MAEALREAKESWEEDDQPTDADVRAIDAAIARLDVLAKLRKACDAAERRRSGQCCHVGPCWCGWLHAGEVLEILDGKR